MGIDQADHAGHTALWIDVATRLREVREAERRFLDLWDFEQADIEPVSVTEPANSTHEASTRWVSNSSHRVRHSRRRRRRSQ